jgi:hypothetical protein
MKLIQKLLFVYKALKKILCFRLPDRPSLTTYLLSIFFCGCYLIIRIKKLPRLSLTIKIYLERRSSFVTLDFDYSVLKQIRCFRQMKKKENSIDLGNLLLSVVIRLPCTTLPPSRAIEKQYFSECYRDMFLNE